jgi:putative heme-binding domain-containing protein
MNAFTRDNTNDGDGWDVRLSYIVPSGNYGYPRLFKNFPDEIIQPMMDLGGGSPCGSLYVDEPGLPGDSGRMLYTVEWGRSGVMRHPLTADGAGFKAKEEKWMDLPRGTDIDVDGAGRFYVTSWANGGFDYSGPDVGYVVRLVPKGHKPEALPDLKKANNDELMAHLASASAVRRMAAQREMLHRGVRDFADALEELALAPSKPMEARAAAIFTLAQLPLPRADVVLAQLQGRDAVRELALRALADRRTPQAVAAAPQFAHALGDADPRVRLVAAWGLGRLGQPESAGALVHLLGDSDPLVEHVAVNSLISLRAADACLQVLDSSTPRTTPGAARVLQALHEVHVVDGLIDRLGRLQDPALRAPVYRALCRLAYREADWDGGWWGTRPDTSGPYYKATEWEGTAKVKKFLSGALATERPEVVRTLVVELKRHKIDLPEAGAVAARLAQEDPTFRGVLVDLLATKRGLTAEDVGLLRGIAVSGDNLPALRAHAVRLLAQENDNAGALEAAVDALATVVSSDKPAAELDAALLDVTRDPRFGRQVGYFAKVAESDAPAKREVGYAVLLNLANARLNGDKDRGRGRARAAAAEAVERGWSDPSRAVSLLHAIARTKATGYESQVGQRKNDGNAEVARAAATAAERLNLSALAATPKGAATLESLGLEKVVALVREQKGDAKAGAELFTRQGCVACHTVSAEEPPKGPFLGGVALKYSRPELCESILKPSAKIAQGFETQWFKTRSGDVVEGFVTRESGDDVEFRNATGAGAVLRKQEIERRGKRDTSVMPEGLVGNLSPEDFANLLAYLESLKGK